jgi:hypothetical protein
MRPWSLSIGLLALVAMATPGAAREVLLHNRFVTCVAASPNVVRLWVDGVGFDVATDHSSAHAVVHLQLRSNAEVAYAVSGRADLIKKDLAPNTGGRVIAYAGVECTVFHRNITSVHDCRGPAGQRSCEVGVDFQGERHAYLVSLTIKPATSVQATSLSH